MSFSQQTKHAHEHRMSVNGGGKPRSVLHNPKGKQQWRPHALLSTVSAQDIGIHSGNKVNLSIEPAPDGAGVKFFRQDLGECFVLEPGCVFSTNRSTTIGRDNIHVISMVEHLLSTLAACGIQDCVIRLDGPEMPIFDGSAKGYLDLIMAAGIKPVSRGRICRVMRRIEFEINDSRYVFLPAEWPSIEVQIDYPHPMIGKQAVSIDVSAISFAREVSAARTFGFIEDRHRLASNLLGRGATMNNVLLFDRCGVINPEGLRNGDECARHKWLDLLGDLYIVGRPVFGKVQASRPGHTNNRIALDRLLAVEDGLAWQSVAYEVPPLQSEPLSMGLDHSKREAQRPQISLRK